MSDDGIREVHEDFITAYPTGRKERDIRKMYDFGGIYGNNRFRMLTGGRHCGKNTFRNYLIQAANARNLAMNMNYAEIEKLVMVSYLKCKTIVHC